MRYKLKLFLKGKTILDTNSGKKKRFFSQIASKKWDNAYLRVVYKDDIYNDGWYLTKEELKKAYQDFAEKDLIDFALMKKF